ncbi:hypothetical protein, partial [Paenibacillus xylanexedens]|uniref:hypothetical protein n=1 Tax=Paenibacillus xylanexedens TaxID=528191 RepID=UPI00119F348C
MNELKERINAQESVVMVGGDEDEREWFEVGRDEGFDCCLLCGGGVNYVVKEEKEVNELMRREEV